MKSIRALIAFLPALLIACGASPEDGLQDGLAQDGPSQDSLSQDSPSQAISATEAEVPIGLKCNQDAVEILGSTNDGAWFARRVLPEEIPAFIEAQGGPLVRGDAEPEGASIGAPEAQYAVAPETQSAAPYWCDDKPCWSCAGTCWFWGKPVYYEGRTQWDGANCYCVGQGYYWNCCQ